MWCMGLTTPRNVESSSWSRDRTHVPYIVRQILNPWTTRKVEVLLIVNVLPGTKASFTEPASLRHGLNLLRHCVELYHMTSLQGNAELSQPLSHPPPTFVQAAVLSEASIFFLHHLLSSSSGFQTWLKHHLAGENRMSPALSR